MEEVYVEPPKVFSSKDKLDKIFLLWKSLYGLKQNPKASFDKLSAGLIEGRFTPSTHDTWLFMKKDMICVVYVNDTIIAGRDSDAIEHEINL